MTLVSDVVYAAYREGNLIPIGTQPTTAEQTDAALKLNSFMFSLFGESIGENLIDWIAPAPQRTAPVAANYPQLPYPQNIDFDDLPLPLASDPDIVIWPYPPVNSRIIWGGVTMTAWFPEAPNDGARMSLVQGSGAGDNGQVGAVLTLDGNGRTIGGQDTVTYTDPLTASVEWMYHSKLGDWEPIQTLALIDTIPFSREMDDLWITGLAIRLAPGYGKSVAAETADTYTRMMAKAKAKYRQAGTTVYGSMDFPRSLQSYISGRLWW